MILQPQIIKFYFHYTIQVCYLFFYSILIWQLGTNFTLWILSLSFSIYPSKYLSYLSLSYKPSSVIISCLYSDLSIHYWRETLRICFETLFTCIVLLNFRMIFYKGVDIFMNFARNFTWIFIEKLLKAKICEKVSYL